jgi:hypothetical protein
MHIYLNKERKETEIPLLGKAVPCSWLRIPILSGPLLAVSSSPTPASHQKDIYLHTDNINMPTTSVRHKRVYI